MRPCHSPYFQPTKGVRDTAVRDTAGRTIHGDVEEMGVHIGLFARDGDKDARSHVMICTLKVFSDILTTLSILDVDVRYSEGKGCSRNCDKITSTFILDSVPPVWDMAAETVSQ